MEAVIFDMDGVIIDSELLHTKLERELLEEYGGKISKEEHEAFIGTTDYYMWSTLKAKFDLAPSVDELVKIKKKRFAQNMHKIRLVDNFYEFMLKLYNKKYALALASSNNRTNVDQIMQKFDLGQYIKVSISGEEVVKSKPDPEIFLKAAQKLAVKPHHCLVIEDATAGVLAAKSAGMQCLGFKNPNSGQQDLSKADLVVESFKELTLDNIKKLFQK